MTAIRLLHSQACFCLYRQNKTRFSIKTENLVWLYLSIPSEGSCLTSDRQLARVASILSFN